MKEGRQRVVVEGVTPEIDCGEFAIKRTAGEKVVVEADVFAEGHDAISCVLCYRKTGPGRPGADWTEATMEFLGNDHWRGEFTVAEIGRYEYTLQAWVDRYTTWASDMRKRVGAGQDVSVERLIGARLIEEARQNAHGADAAALQAYEDGARGGGREATEQELSDGLAELLHRHLPRAFATYDGKSLVVDVDRERARFGAWYEMFPRSCSPTPGAHGTFKDCEARLPYIASMGFDVLYLPPIHPVGRMYRKGRNNAIESGREDAGSPWAIGGPEGGHKSVHPDLGTLDDFRHFVGAARQHGLEIALDIAFQTSPDHPYVTEHPEWFRMRPDGTIQYAENPPKKYQDIYPFDFETPHWRELWDELKSIFDFWMAQGVRIFRVDNPHTKSFTFWEWLIGEIRREAPDVIFLAEAFTRPRVMQRLAKLGFTQSYTYFAWRNTPAELAAYFTELTNTQVREYYRPNVWPNTPDILTEYLQLGGRPAFVVRFVLAATLAASYGIYGPAFELHENRAIVPGQEEYLDSEKYQIRNWDLARPDSLRGIISRVNAIRRDNPALHGDWSLRFHPVDDSNILCYSKQTESLDNVIVVVVNVDPHYGHRGNVELPLESLGIDPRRPYQMHDLLNDVRYLWNGPQNVVELDPELAPARIFRVRRHLRTEHDFDYYM